MADRFERVTLEAIERADSDPSGFVRGVAGSDGEAADGHIVDVGGLVCEAPASMLFGHDAYSQRGTVGSWQKFTKTKREGQRVVIGEGQIELGGVGASAEERQDLAYMTDRRHFRALSMRWEPLDAPVPRTSLSQDHFAYVDAQKEKDPRKRWGYYFPKSRLLEVSIVPMGADPLALIGRLRSAEVTPVARAFLRGALSDLLSHGSASGAHADAVSRFRAAIGELRALGVEDFGTLLRGCGDTTDPNSLVAVEYGNGRRLLIPRDAFDVLTRASMQRLETAFDLLADGAASELPADLEPITPATEPEREVTETVARSIGEEDGRAAIAGALADFKDSTTQQMRRSLRTLHGR